MHKFDVEVELCQILIAILNPATYRSVCYVLWIHITYKNKNKINDCLRRGMPGNIRINLSWTRKTAMYESKHAIGTLALRTQLVLVLNKLYILQNLIMYNICSIYFLLMFFRSDILNLAFGSVCTL